MGGKLPGKDFSVQDVANLVGPDRSVDVIGESASRLHRADSRCCHTVFVPVDIEAVGRIRQYRCRPDS